jgi:hypothetical protein
MSPTQRKKYSLLERAIGVPLSRARRWQEIEEHLKFRDASSYRAIVSENVTHITQKSGALLAAQAIFLVFQSYGIDHGWSRNVVLISMLMLLSAAMLVMSNLRSVWLPSSSASDEQRAAEHVAIMQLSDLTSMRGARFNVALYLTFLSVSLMAIAAVMAALM